MEGLYDEELAAMIADVEKLSGGAEKIRFLREIMDPTVRAWIYSFKAYGSELKRYLHFVENEQDNIIEK